MQRETNMGPSQVPFLLNKRGQEVAVVLGGAEDFREYEQSDCVPYCDKGNHRESSLFHAPQHREHWKKEEKKRRGE